jgi:hypothetical protein
MRRLVLLACLAGVLGTSAAGCSGGGDSTLSHQDQAKAKESKRKRFGSFGENTQNRKTSR